MAGSAEITRQSVATYNVESPVGAEVMAEARGSYRGEQVTQSSEESKIAEAAEELGMSVAHRADKKSLGQRSVRPGQAAYPEALARLREMLEELPDMPRDEEIVALVEKLQSFQELLQKGRGGASKDDILPALHAFDPDVTHQAAGLDVARAHFESAGADKTFLDLLETAGAVYREGDLGRDVRAGFAVAGIASRAAPTLETDPAALRDAYRSMLRDTPSLGQLFDALAPFAVLKTFQAAVETFVAAAGHDLSHAGPSTEPAFLHGLLTELSKLRRMQTTFDAVGDLIQLTERSLPAGQRDTVDPVAQTSRLLNFAALPAAGHADARRLLGTNAERPLGVQLAYANGLRGIHGEVPDEAMPSIPARLQQVKAILSLLDEIVAAEEASFNAAASTANRTA